MKDTQPQSCGPTFGTSNPFEGIELLNEGSFPRPSALVKQASNRSPLADEWLRAAPLCAFSLER